MEKILSGKTLLITGGTSRLGKTFCRKALAQGARVFLTWQRNQAEACELERLGAETFQADFSSTFSMNGLVAALKSKTKTLDILIHNAAAVRDRTLHNLTEEDWDTVMAVNLKAPYYLTKELMGLLFRAAKSSSREDGKRGCAKIFMITSRLGVSGGYGVANYAAAKAGLIALAKSLAQELGRKNILVNAVNPGFMESAMTRDLPEMVFEQNRAASPLGRFSDPEEVADFLVYLCSEAMSQVTGQVFHYESRKI